MSLKKNNITIRFASDNDIPSVKKLLERYHVKNLDVHERENGFVTTDMTIPQLSELCHSENGVLIAVDENTHSVAGLLLGASWQFLTPWPIFNHMANILNHYELNGKKLDRATSYQYGPICIAEEYRSQGIGESLLAYQRQVFSARYTMAVTFVNVLNSRSYAFHTRSQFENVGCFDFNNNRYYIMAISTR